jgi:hypothetical protein
VGFALALACAAALWAARRYTAAGFRARGVGLNPFAAATSGLIAVSRVETRAFLASGALAGLAGAVEVTGVTFALYESLSPGYGYTAIAVALLARLDPLGVVGTGILFGALEAGAAAMQRDAGVPAVLATVVEAVMILLVLVATAGILLYGQFLLNPANRGDLLPYLLVVVAEAVLVLQALFAMWTILSGGADPRDPLVSPLFGDLARLPPALVQVAEHDPIRDDGLRYAAALEAAGVPVRTTTYVGMPHGYLAFPRLCRSAPQALGELCAELARALAPAAAPAGG